MLRQQSYAIKNQLGHPKPSTRGFGTQNTILGVFCLLLAGSLWHKGAYKRTFPCMEANYPYTIKNQRRASNGIRGLWMPELVLYGIRLQAQATLEKLSTNESRSWCKFLDLLRLTVTPTISSAARTRQTAPLRVQERLRSICLIRLNLVPSEVRSQIMRNQSILEL